MVSAVAFWVVRKPKIYQAVTTLEYDPNPAGPLGSALKSTEGGWSEWWNNQEFLETQNYILHTRTVAERVVRKLSLHTDEDFMGVPQEERASFTPTSVEKAALVLLERYSVDPVRDTRIVRVHVRDWNPERAQLIANAIVETYIDKSLEDKLGASSGALEWLNGQMQNLKQELESAELALYNFREQNQTLSASLEERTKLIAGQLQRYSEALTEVRTRRIATEAKLGVLREELAANPDPLTAHAGPVATDADVEVLRGQYRTTDEALQKLLVTYGESHPEVRALKAALGSIRTQLDAHVTGIVSAVEAEVRQLTQAEAGIQRALDDVNQQGLQLSLQEIEYTRLDRERGSKAELFDVVLNRAAETDLTRALRLAHARVLDRAIVPQVPVSPNLRLSAVLAIFAGFGLGLAAAFAAAKLDNKVRGTSDLEARGLTVLGLLPDVGTSANKGGKRRRARRGAAETSSDLIVHLEPKSPAAECCRTIRTNLTFQSADKPLKTIAVTSAMPRDGKTTASVNIAIAIAQSGKRVLLVDTDLRKPRVHKIFGLPPGSGITSILAGEATVDEVVHDTEVPNLFAMPCGPLPPNPSELLHTRRFADLIDELRTQYDIVIFDSPPLGAVTDPAIIAPQVDGTILVARARSTKRAGIDAAMRQLRGVSARIVGTVINGANLNDAEYGSYYYYYRGGYYAEETPPPGGPTPQSSTGAA